MLCSGFSVMILRVHGSHMDRKTWKKIPVREKSGNFEHTGKVGEFDLKHWKSEGNFSQFLYLSFL